MVVVVVVMQSKVECHWAQIPPAAASIIATSACPNCLAIAKAVLLCIPAMHTQHDWLDLKDVLADTFDRHWHQSPQYR